MAVIRLSHLSHLSHFSGKFFLFFFRKYTYKRDKRANPLPHIHILVVALYVV